MLNFLLMVGLSVNILGNAITSYSQLETYYVHSDESNTSCHELQTKNATCNDLTFYTQPENKDVYFKSHVRFEFLDGIFCHNTNFSIENIYNLTLTSRFGNSTIDCSGYDNAGFVFINVTHLRIANLTFKFCGQIYTIHTISSTHEVQAAILCSYGKDHQLYNVQVLYSRNENIHYNNVTGNISLEKCKFAHTKDYSLSAGNSFFFGNDNSSEETNLTITNTQFFNNSNREEKEERDYFAAGLLIVLKTTTVKVTLDQVILDRNQGYQGGNLALVYHNISHWFTSAVHIKNTTVTNGKAAIGGGICVTFVEKSPIHMDNVSTNLSTARTILELSNVTISGNDATKDGGGIYLRQKESLTYYSPARITIVNCTFRNNTLEKEGHGGVAIHSITYIAPAYQQHSKPQFHLDIVNSNFSEHDVSRSSGKGVIFAKTSSHVNITSVIIHNNNCSGILGVGSNFVMSGKVNISNNHASSGGGILFCSDSVMFLTPNTTLTIENNTAKHAGGGICIESECLQSQPMCFFQLDEKATINPNLTDSIQIYLKNNTAKYAGNELYGGSVNYCYMLDSPLHNAKANDSMSVFRKIFKSEPKDDSDITSPPQRVCLCNKTNKCNVSIPHTEVYPGETFSLYLLTVGQLNGTVPGTIKASLKDTKEEYQLGTNEDIQSSKNKCRKFNYTIYTNAENVNVTLHLQVLVIGDASFTERLGKHFNPLKLNVHLKQCPIGFKLTNNQNDHYLCDCTLAMVLKHTHDMTCNITNRTLTRKRKFWIGYEKKAQNYLYSDSIALEYCVPDDIIYIKVGSDYMEQDIQCKYSRTGILCGACPINYSVILGSSECRKNCSNFNLFLLAFFAIAGVLLVFLLTFLNLTVAEGTLSGVIFYANIVQIHRSAFFQYHSVPVFTKTLLLFVSWINLDFGIQACFYKGMNEYDKAWLQFLFPVYIWMIAGLVVFLSRWFDSLAKLFGNNGVKVLATLILLSYSKMLRSIIATFHYQIIHHYNDTTHESVPVLHWKPDANILFLHGKQIPLFITGLIFFLITIPFTLILLCIQNLQKVSTRRGFTWVWKLKPFFDTYTGPYSKHARFWTGLLLLIRAILLSISATNYTGIEITNFFFTIIACAILFVIEWTLRPGVYEKRSLDVLECSFLLNLCLLCTVTAYVSTSDSVHGRWLQSSATHISVSIALITFIGIVLYQGYKQGRKYLNERKQTRYTNSSMEEPTTTVTTTEVCIDEDNPHDNVMSNFPPVVRFDQDREPLLGSLSTSSSENN